MKKYILLITIIFLSSIVTYGGYKGDSLGSHKATKTLDYDSNGAINISTISILNQVLVDTSTYTGSDTVRIGNGSIPKLAITSTGTVYLNTAAPNLAMKFHCNGRAQIGLTKSDTVGNGEIQGVDGLWVLRAPNAANQRGLAIDLWDGVSVYKNRVSMLGSNGNVGISTNTPIYKLDVFGDARITEDITEEGDSSAEFYVLPSGTATTTISAGVYTPILGTFLTNGLDNFTFAGSTLTYTGTQTSSFTITCPVSAADVGAGSDEGHFRIAINGTTLERTEQHRKFSANDIGSITVATRIQLATNDEISLWVTSEGGNNYVVEHINFVVEEQGAQP
jgi:hypothetical protein